MTRKRRINYDDGRQKHGDSHSGPKPAPHEVGEFPDDEVPASSKSRDSDDPPPKKKTGGIASWSLRDWLVVLALLAVCLFFLFRGYGGIIPSWMR
jgi:hypothetical protein